MACYVQVGRAESVERIRLKSGRVYEGTILNEGENFIEIDFYGRPLKLYRHEIKEIGGKAPVTPQGALKRTLYGVYRASQMALEANDKAAYKAALSQRRAVKLEAELDAFIQSLALLRSFGADPAKPKIPEYVEEFPDTAILYLSDPFQEKQGFYAEQTHRGAVTVERLRFARESSGWKIDHQETLIKPAWMSYALFELSRTQTEWSVPESWSVQYYETSDPFLFERTDIAQVAFADDLRHLYIKLIFPDKELTGLPDINIYFTNDPQNLAWITSRNNPGESIAGWQRRLQVRRGRAPESSSEVSYYVIDGEYMEFPVPVDYPYEKGWIKWNDHALMLKVPLALLDLVPDQRFQFSIIELGGGH